MVNIFQPYLRHRSLCQYQSSNRKFLLVKHFVTQLQNQRTLTRMNTKALWSLKTHRTPHPRRKCHTLCILSLHKCKILKMATRYNMKQQHLSACYTASSYHCENNLWQRQTWWLESSSFWTSLLCFNRHNNTESNNYCSHNAAGEHSSHLVYDTLQTCIWIPVYSMS
jgi:hypothetical protein